MAGFKEVLQKNLTSLCKFTNCSKNLLQRCIEEKILTLYALQEIDSENSNYSKNRKFYNNVCRLNEAKFQSFVAIMCEPNLMQPQQVLKILNVNFKDNILLVPNFVIQKWQISQIAEILTKSSLLISNGELFSLRLGVSESATRKISKLHEFNSDDNELVQNILEHWISWNGAKSTLEKLVQTLNELGAADVADELVKEIRNGNIGYSMLVASMM